VKYLISLLARFAFLLTITGISIGVTKAQTAKSASVSDPVITQQLKADSIAARQQTGTELSATKTASPAAEFPAVKQGSKATTAPNLIEAAADVKESSNALLATQQKEIATAETKLEDLRKLVADGLVARVELETAEQKLSALKTTLAATQKQISDSDKLIAYVKADQARAAAEAAKPKVKLVSNPYSSLNSSASILKGTSLSLWSISNLGNIQSFFFSTFGHALPTSAIGQSVTHDHLGYDHRNAVDVALHPDSAEGRGLIAYLQANKIPFLAFRNAIPGVATGPHIHIGLPSHRL
jgi:hypothetical protein